MAGILYCLSPLPALEAFDGHDEAFARGRLVRLLLYDAITQPQDTWEYWEGPGGTWWLVDRAGVLLTAAGILLVSVTAGAAVLAIGRRLFRRADADAAIRWTPLERASFSVGLGLSSVSLLVRMLGFFPLSRILFLTISSLAALLALGVGIWAYLTTHGGKGSVKSHADSSPPPTSLPWLWLTLPPAIVILLGGLLPPLDFDVLEYHLQAPKEFFQQGRVAFLPHNVYANMPLGSEMFALLGMHVTGDWWTGALVGKTIMAAYALATGLAVLALGQRLGGPAVGVVAAALYLATPWTIRLANLGLNENALALYAVLTAHAAYLWIVTRRVELLLLAGFLAGSAASIKYTGLLFVAAPLVVAVIILFVLQERRIGTFSGRQLAACFGLVLLAIVSACWPWYAANWWNTGNPVYPLLGQWFETPSRDLTLAAQWNAAHAPPNYSAADLAGRLADFAWRSEWHNPLLVAFAAVTLLFSRAGWKWWFAGYLAFYFAAWWLLTHRLDRFWTPAIPAMALLAGGAAASMTGKFGRRVIQGALVAWLAICLLWAVHPASLCGYTRLLASYDWLRFDPDRISPWRQNVNEFAGPEQAVLAVGDAAVFDIDARVYYNTVFDPWLLREWLGDSENPREQSLALHAELLERNVRYVYIEWDELVRYRRTYDRAFHRSDFITPQLFDRLIEHGVLAPLATRVAGANVSLLSVNRPEGDDKNTDPDGS